MISTEDIRYAQAAIRLGYPVDRELIEKRRNNFPSSDTVIDAILNDAKDGMLRTLALGGVDKDYIKAHQPDVTNEEDACDVVEGILKDMCPRSLAPAHLRDDSGLVVIWADGSVLRYPVGDSIRLEEQLGELRRSGSRGHNHRSSKSWLRFIS